MVNYYHTLGVSEVSSQEEITSAYVKLAKKFDPDNNDGDSYFANMFQRVKEAYNILRDPYEREKHNERIESYLNHGNQSSEIHSINVNREIINSEPMKVESSNYRPSAGIAILSLIIPIIGIIIYFNLRKKEPEKAKEILTISSIGIVLGIILKLIGTFLTK